MIVIESTGRKLKDAIDNGLAKLNKTLMDVEVEVLDNGGLFRKAKVRITVKGDDEPAIEKQPVSEERNEQPVKSERKTTERKCDTKKEFKREHKTTEDRREFKKPEEHKIEGGHKLEGHKPEGLERENNERDESKEFRHFTPITEEVAAQAEHLAREIVTRMGVDMQITSSIQNGGVVINFEAHSSELIGYHGEVLDAIEYLISCAINKDENKFYRVVVDCDNYRAKRKDSLVALANRMAAKCLKVRHKIVLEPMNSNERRIIHAALATNDKIITKSEGHEPNRRVVIFCKKR